MISLEVLNVEFYILLALLGLGHLLHSIPLCAIPDENSHIEHRIYSK